jgi:hypothetical protein
VSRRRFDGTTDEIDSDAMMLLEEAVIAEMVEDEEESEDE